MRRKREPKHRKRRCVIEVEATGLFISDQWCRTHQRRFGQRETCPDEEGSP